MKVDTRESIVWSAACLIWTKGGWYELAEFRIKLLKGFNIHISNKEIASILKGINPAFEWKRTNKGTAIFLPEKPRRGDVN